MYDLQTEKFFFIFCLLLLNKVFVTLIEIDKLIINFIHSFKKYCKNQDFKEYLLFSIILISQYKYIAINQLRFIVTAIKIRGIQNQLIHRKFTAVFFISIEILVNKILLQAIVLSNSLYVKNCNNVS